MAIQLLGQDGSSVAAVDGAFLAQRVSMRPMQSLGWNSIAAPTGLVTGVAAGGAIFSLRNISANLLLVKRVGVGFVLTTAFTAAQRLEFGLMVQRNFTASDSGGTAIALTGNNGKHRTSLATPTSLDCRISTTAALTAGTKTADANFIGLMVGSGNVALNVVVAPSMNNLFDQDPQDYPLVLAQNEGFNVVNNVAMGAVGAGIAYVSVEIAEAQSY